MENLENKVAHLDYYSNDTLAKDNYRVAPVNSAAYTRPPRIILVKLEMARKDVCKLLEENEQLSDDMDISIEVEHISDLRYKGKIVFREEEIQEEEIIEESEAETSQYVTVDEIAETEEHTPTAHGDQLDETLLEISVEEKTAIEVVNVKEPLSKFWTEEELTKIQTKPSTVMGSLVDAQGPFFIVKLDDDILGEKELYLNPFNIKEYEPTEEVMQGEFWDIYCILG